MVKLGYTSPFSELSVFKAECFMIIDVEIDKARNTKKGKTNGR